MPEPTKPKLGDEEREILHHTLTRAAGRHYCGNSTAMQNLVAAGYMRSLGKAAWCPDEYFTITPEGKRALAADLTPEYPAPGRMLSEICEAAGVNPDELLSDEEKEAFGD